MATLKGQNFRILTLDNAKYKVVGMATSCTVTLTNNTEDEQTKDDVGTAARPVTNTQGWSVSVESLSVADVGAMLTAIKNKTLFTLMWDETDTADNQSLEGAGYSRGGTALLNDATFTFNDRETASKSLQFTGSGALSTFTSTPAAEAIAVGSYTKGQFVRLFLSADNTAAPDAVIAAAKQLSLHVSLTLEDATTKDTAGKWVVQEATDLAYDISSMALVRGNDTITSAVAGKALADIVSLYEGGSPVKWQIANVSGDNQRAKGAIIASGSALVQTLTINAAVKSNATYTTQLQGYGPYTVGA